MLPIQLKDKVVVITGAGKGLGKELARILSVEGCKTVICSRSENDLAKLCKEITDNGGKCEYSVVDVTNKKQVYGFIDKTMKKQGRIDVIINNAGYINEWKEIEKITEQEFENNFKTNVYSTYYFLKKIVPVMRKQGEGVIVNISSMAGKRGLPNLTGYCASKFAVIGLTQSVAKELENANVFCFAVCPGGMDTRMRTKLFGDEDSKRQQSPNYVASVIRDVLVGKIKIPNGGDISIRHGKITAITPPPEY